MSYSMNLDNEKAPNVKQLLPQGWRIFTILSGEETTSKSGNAMFKFNIRDLETEYCEDIYCVSVEGKRWLLKQILSSCGIEKDASGNYTWDIKDILNKEILGKVNHKPNEYINRNGDTIKTTQHKIVEFKKFVPTNIDGKPVNPGAVTDPEQIQWKD